MTNNSKWFNYEGLDRTSMLIAQLNTAFWDGAHPSLDTEQKKELYQAALESLLQLYQKIGETEFGEDFDNDPETH